VEPAILLPRPCVAASPLPCIAVLPSLHLHMECSPEKNVLPGSARSPLRFLSLHLVCLFGIDTSAMPPATAMPSPPTSRRGHDTCHGTFKPRATLSKIPDTIDHPRCVHNAICYPYRAQTWRKTNNKSLKGRRMWCHCTWSGAHVLDSRTDVL